MKKIHFIGIGGIGVSALAQYYLAMGYKVSGSDLASSEISGALRKKGAKLFIGKHKSKNLPKDVDLIIYSLAVPKSNPELKKAYEIQNTDSKTQILSYPQALGELTRKYFTIAISGTHGKSTTTAMIALILTKAGLDPTVIVGTKIKEFNDSNCRVGKSKYLVIEACEHKESFLNYWPKIIVVTNIEREHLDYYKNLRNILSAFKKFIKHLPKDGSLIINKDDKNISKLKTQNSKPQLKTKNYSLKQSEAKILKKILKIPGEHNVYNALAALTIAKVLKIPDKISFKALSEYKGSWRRFEIKKIKFNEKRSRQITLVNDYGHHPTEIQVTLTAAREKYPRKKIWCIFQPHQYQRTYYLFNDFVKILSEALIDKLIITDVYDVAGRENKEIKREVNSQRLVQSIKKCKSIPLSNQRLSAENVIYLSNFQKITDYLKKNLRGREVVIIMGAGDIYKLINFFHLTEIK